MKPWNRRGTGYYSVSKQDRLCGITILDRRHLLDCYGSLNYEVGSFRKEKDQLMKFLTAAARLKGFRFTEFEA